MAIQLARHLGTQVLVAADSAEESRFLRDQLCVSEEMIVSNPDATAARGLVVDVLFGSIKDASLDSLMAPFGRVIKLASSQFYRYRSTGHHMNS